MVSFCSDLYVCMTRRGCWFRVALLEKLGTVPEATFDDADLHQLYQAYVLLDPPGAELFHVLYYACTEPLHPAEAYVYSVERYHLMLMAVTFLTIKQNASVTMSAAWVDPANLDGGRP